MNLNNEKIYLNGMFACLIMGLFIIFGIFTACMLFEMRCVDQELQEIRKLLDLYKESGL